MKNTKTIFAVLMLWILIMFIGILYSYIFNKEYFILRCLLIWPFCILGVNLTKKFIKE